jgi:hypothetical protein
MSTQSGDDAKRSTVLAKLHLEDGTTLVGRSFGSHESVDGEVRNYLHFQHFFLVHKQTLTISPFRL